jgi:NAD(P)-dependent dehydrogenase (short-subunit alcohol dehydrogenase family)
MDAVPHEARRVTCITGGASGLGWALAEACLARGDAVVLADRDDALLAQREAQVGDPSRLLAVAGDLTDDGARTRLVEAVSARFGRLDVLVHNAGITHRSPAKRTDPAVIRRVMEVNYHLPVALTALALPLLRASRGSLVGIGSMAGWMPVPGRAGYGASKAALAQYFEVLRQELVADGVHVLMAYPSFLDTPIERNALGADGGAAPHARSTVGRIRSAPWQAARIVAALEARRAEVPREWLPAFGAWLWATWPALHRRLMARRFGGELG